MLRLPWISAWQLVACASFFVASPAAAAKIACVGDSITAGYGLTDPMAEAYPAVLGELVGASHTVTNFGVSGTTLLTDGDLPYWDEPEAQASRNFAPDVVIMMLGTNDSKPQNWAKKDEFKSDYLARIEEYRALGAVVYVATPPRVFAPGMFMIPPEVIENAVAPLVKEIANEAGAPLIDVFEATQDSTALFPDTVHPNALGAELIAQTVNAALVTHGFEHPVMEGTGGADGTGSGGLENGGDGGGESSSGGTSSGAAGSASDGGSTSGSGGTGVSDGGSNSGGSAPAGVGGLTSAGGSAPASGGSADPASASGGCQLGSRPIGEWGGFVSAALLFLTTRRRRRGIRP